MRIVSSTLCCLLLTAVASITPTNTAHADYFRNVQCERSQVVSFWEREIAGSTLSGSGVVCGGNRGLWSHMQVRGLAPGSAYTVWWVYIDNPAACANVRLTPENSEVPFPEPENYAGRCGLADFFTPGETGESLDPLAVFGRMDSAIGGNGQRTWFAGDLRGLKPSPGSQVWMFIFGHGPADLGDGRQLARQLLTPEDPGAGAPHLGIEGRPFGYPAGVVVIEMS